MEKSREQCIEELAKIIEDNPDCEFQIDDNHWRIMKNKSKRTYDNAEEVNNILADSYDYSYTTNWFLFSYLYGSGLSEALVYLLNKKGFNIKAESV